jgi:long-chain acyl-CoA synthetase
MNSLLVEHLLHTEAHHNRPVIYEGETTWTFDTFRDQVYRVSWALTQHGLKPGDRVALLLGNQKEYLVSLLAILHAGGVVVPVNSTMPPETIGYVIQDSGAKRVIANPSFLALLQKLPLTVFVTGLNTSVEKKQEQHPTEQAPDGLADIRCYQTLLAEEAPSEGNLSDTHSDMTYPEQHAMRILMYTSGTTGNPKGVMLTEGNLLANLEGITQALTLQADDRMLLALPLFHAYGQIIALLALQQQASLYLEPSFSPKAIIQTLQKESISVLPLVPTMFTMLLTAVKKYPGLTFPGLKWCISGGAALPEKLLSSLKTELGLTVLEGYGLTETAPVIAVNRFQTGAISGSVGSVLHNVTVRLMAETGLPLSADQVKAGETGEIVVKGANVMQGYYNLPEESHQAFDADGYFKTGDLGHFDANGNLYLSSGRKKDLIIRAGENIAPVQIENILHRHPNVRAVAVFGIPDEKTGEEMVACIEASAPSGIDTTHAEPGTSLTASQLKQFCLESLPAFMVPRYFWILPESDSIPKNQLGKALKAVLKRQWLEKNQHSPSSCVTG